MLSWARLNHLRALDLARAALADCRKRGFQVAIVVGDRFGVIQVVLRDRYARPYTRDRFRQGLDCGDLPEQHKQSFCHQSARDDAGRYS